MKKIRFKIKSSKPSQWAKFSHSASFLDAKIGIKSVMHKLLIRALVGGNSIRDNIVIATTKSTPENITISKSKIHAIPKMLKFSVGRGLRVAYKPLMNINNRIIVMDGKQVYKEIPSIESTYRTNVFEIYKLTFKQSDGNEADFQHFESFLGLLKLMKKHLDVLAIQRTHDRYINLLWGLKPQRGQELEVGNPELDFEIKNNGYQRLIKELKIKDISNKYIEMYYRDYGKRIVSFRNYLI